MKFTVLASLITAASALKANTSTGKNLLSNSRRVEGEADEVDYSWIGDYSLQFASCHTVESVNFNADGDNEDGASAVGSSTIVKFKLCPTDDCGYNCKGAMYLTSMAAFVNSYTEWQMNDAEYRCEAQRETCETDCQYYEGEEDTCYYNCFSAVGMADTCGYAAAAEDGEEQEEQEEFNLQEYLECKELEADAYGVVYYVGPKCSSNGQRINLGVFTDQYCTTSYASNIFTTIYGTTLPYTEDSMVSEYCIACNAADGANNNGYYEDVELTEICDESYAKAAKCENAIASSLSSPDNSACDYMSKLYMYEVGYAPSNQSTAVALAVIFGLSTVALAAIAVKATMDTKRKIGLNDDSAVV
jgi:hypothetical protein